MRNHAKEKEILGGMGEVVVDLGVLSRVAFIIVLMFLSNKMHDLPFG